MERRPRDRPPGSGTPAGGRRLLGRLQGFRRKNWDAHVGDLAEMANSSGFQALRDQIIELADPDRSDTVLDVGAGTGLLTLDLAPRVRQVHALDVSGAMCEHLQTEVDRRRMANVRIIQSSAITVPLPDQSVDLVVSNYCFHHLRDVDKERALGELGRVLRPDGRLVFADMMFRVNLTDQRNRAVVAGLVFRLLRRGPAGVLRIAKNAFRYLTGRWEQPAEVGWWRGALVRAGFEDVEVRPLEHEGGIASARRPRVIPVAAAAASEAPSTR